MRTGATLQSTDQWEEFLRKQLVETAVIQLVKYLQKEDPLKNKMYYEKSILCDDYVSIIANGTSISTFLCTGA